MGARGHLTRRPVTRSTMATSSSLAVWRPVPMLSTWPGGQIVGHRGPRAGLDHVVDVDPVPAHARGGQRERPRRCGPPEGRWVPAGAGGRPGRRPGTPAGPSPAVPGRRRRPRSSREPAALVAPKKPRGARGVASSMGPSDSAYSVEEPEPDDGPAPVAQGVDEPGPARRVDGHGRGPLGRGGLPPGRRPGRKATSGSVRRATAAVADRVGEVDLDPAPAPASRGAPCRRRPSRRRPAGRRGGAPTKPPAPVTSALTPPGPR